MKFKWFVPREATELCSAFCETRLVFSALAIWMCISSSESLFGRRRSVLAARTSVCSEEKTGSQKLDDKRSASWHRRKAQLSNHMNAWVPEQAHRPSPMVRLSLYSRDVVISGEKRLQGAI